MHRTILTKVHEGYLLEEGTLTAVAVSPGMLLERTSAGTFQAHSTAGGPAEMLVCIEDYLQGKGVEDWYSASGRVLFVAATKGDVFAMRIKDASPAGTITIGEFLESDGAGKLQAWASPTGAVDSASDLSGDFFPLAVALEAIDMADSSGVVGAGHIKVRVL